MRFSVACFLSCFLLSSAVHSDSIWKTGVSSSPYSNQKAYRVGDIITVLILESTSALQKAGTTTNVRDDLSVNFNHSIERLYPSIQPSTQVQGGARNDYKGLGETTRSSNIKTTISAKVLEVLQNGNLKIKGVHRVDVNENEQKIEITGIIRSKDVSMSNTVYSYQVADSNISIIGKGAVGEAESPGWITRIMNWIF
jgi:flagellar L-ring protein precursor FlgH